MSYLNHKYYLLQNEFKEYLCYPDSKQVIIYHHERDRQDMASDLWLTKSKVVAFTKARYLEVFVGMKYSNKDDAPALLEELRLEYEGMPDRGETF